MTERGKACREHLFKSFSYLQLVVEDDQLPIPSHPDVWAMFGFYEKDYRYLVSTPDDYVATLVPLILAKAREVFTFLEILKYEHDHEAYMFSGAFSRLAGDNVQVDVDSLIDYVYLQVTRVLSYLDAKPLVQKVGEARASAKRLGEEVIRGLYEELRSESAPSVS